MYNRLLQWIFSCATSRDHWISLDQVEERNSGTPLLLDVAATDSSNEAHVITDGLAAEEARQMPLLGFLAKSLREANFPTGLARKAGLESCAESLQNHVESKDLSSVLVGQTLS